MLIFIPFGFISISLYDLVVDNRENQKPKLCSLYYSGVDFFFFFFSKVRLVCWIFINCLT